MSEPFNDAGFDHSLTLPLCKAWQSYITSAVERKKRDFGDAADWAMRLWDGRDVEGNFMEKYPRLEEAGVNPPAFLLNVNKIAEALQIFGPAMYVQNPTGHITPRKRSFINPQLLGPSLQSPQMMMQYQQAIQQQQLNDELLRAGSDIFKSVIDYSQHELDAERQCRQWIRDALMTGMGILETKLVTPPGGGPKLVGSFWRPIHDLLIDPDVDAWDDMRVVILRECKKVWEVEEEFNLPPGVLEKYATHETDHREGLRQRRKKGGSYAPRANDRIEVFKVFSKMGIGERLTKDKRVEGMDAIFGQHCYMAISRNVPWPLNLPSWEVDGELALPPEALYYKVQWPIPFWLEHNGWPFTPLYFHEHPEQAWPYGHFRFSKGELEFLNWQKSFVATKTAVSCNTVIGVAKDVADNVKTAFHEARGGFNIIEIPKTAGRKIDELISVMDLPQFNPEIHNAGAIVNADTDKRIGLNDHLFGIAPSRQMRSAQEASDRQANATQRPSFFAKLVDSALARKLRNESFAMRWFLTPQDVAPIVGPAGTIAWQQIITSTDPGSVVREYDFRIEANSSRRPNLEKMQDQANQLLQVVMPFAQMVYQQFGDPTLVNASFEFWSKAFEYENFERFMIPDLRQQVQQQQIDAQKEEQRREEEKHQQELKFELEDQVVENRNRLSESAVKQRILWEEHEAREGNGQP